MVFLSSSTNTKLRKATGTKTAKTYIVLTIKRTETSPSEKKLATNGNDVQTPDSSVTIENA